VLKAYKEQPTIEKHFQQFKTAYQIAPIFLKKPELIEAFFTLYFLAMLLLSLIESELYQAMKLNNMEELPLYPERRQSKKPTTEQIFRLFRDTRYDVLINSQNDKEVFAPDFSDLQCQVLDLLKVSVQSFVNEKIPDFSEIKAAMKFDEPVLDCE
jgi:transposase